MENIKVCIPNDSKSNGIGGGWSFRRNLIKYAPFQVVDSIEEADICLICGVTMISGETFDRMRALNKKIVIRLDGIPEPWRNSRINIAGRLQGWCELADGIIYQSKFTHDLIGKALKLDQLSIPQTIIYNGADQEIFKPEGETVAFPTNGKKILSILWRQDPNKRWDEVLMRFRHHSIENPNDVLIMVGEFPNPDFDFGFIFDEKYIAFGQADEIGMAKVMRSCDEFWFPSFADPCPNTLIEAINCGLKPKFVPKFGGAIEILRIRQTQKWKEILSADTMAKKYNEFFKEILK